jgi:hypothetical protein
MHEARKFSLASSLVIFQTLDKGTRAVSDAGNGYFYLFHEKPSTGE